MTNWSWLSHSLWPQQLNKLKTELQRNNASELRDAFCSANAFEEKFSMLQNVSQQRSVSQHRFRHLHIYQINGSQRVLRGFHTIGDQFPGGPVNTFL
jgi:hypothetical protein